LTDNDYDKFENSTVTIFGYEDDIEQEISPVPDNLIQETTPQASFKKSSSGLTVFFLIFSTILLIAVVGIVLRKSRFTVTPTRFLQSVRFNELSNDVEY